MSLFKKPHLFSKHPLQVIVVFLTGVLLTSLIVLYSQFTALQTHFEKSISPLQAELRADLIALNASLMSITAFTQRSPIEIRSNLLEAISQEKRGVSKKVFALGHYQSTPLSEAPNFFKQLNQAGFESLSLASARFTPANTKNTSPQKTLFIIDTIFPHKPIPLQLLGKDLTTLPNIDNKLTPSSIGSNSKSFFFNFNHASYLLMLSSNASTNQIKKEGLFYIIDILQEIKKEAQDFSTLPLSHIQVHSGTQINHSIPIKTPTTEHPFFTYELTQSFSLDTNGTPLKITLKAPITPNSFDLKSLLISALLGGLFLVATLYALYLIRKNLRRLNIEKTRQFELIEKAHEAIIITSKTGIIKSWNPKAVTVFGYRKAESEGALIQEILFKHLKDTPGTLLKNFQLEELTRQFTTQLIQKNGQWIECEITLSKIQIEETDEWVFFIEDISNQKKREHKIKQLAYYDTLTGLENRTFFSEEVSKLLLEAPHTLAKQGAIFFIDLDGFKKVNDSLGHQTGDELLKIIAKRFQHALRINDEKTHLCRFGGDEFIIYLPNMTAETAGQTAMRLLKQAKKSITIAEHTMQVSASIGIALHPEHGETLASLLQHADTAMYQAKHAGKNTFSLYKQEMEQALSHALLIENHLRNAIQNNEFELFYQPQISTRTEEITGVEALIRWHSSELGFVPPDEFISIAEETGLIIEIGDWVAKTAIQQLKQWQNTPFSHLRIAINVSAHQLSSANFTHNLHQWLANAGVEPEKLEIELTERAVMTNAQDNINIFQEIRSNGLSLSVDDFGTGYSSLSYLKRFPLNILKVDKSFVDGLPGDEDDRAISSAIIQLAHSLRMLVVAEGVETKEQLDFLKNINCDLIQGYYYSKPLTEKAFKTWALNYQTQLHHRQQHD